jgi:hypothetical protein
MRLMLPPWDSFLGVGKTTLVQRDSMLRKNYDYDKTAVRSYLNSIPRRRISEPANNHQVSIRRRRVEREFAVSAARRPHLS